MIKIKFNFKLFAGFAAKAYRNVLKEDSTCVYTFKNVLSVFEYYFYKYEKAFGHAHPAIKVEQIQRIIEAMPFIDNEGFGGQLVSDIDPDDYKPLIDQHLKTEYKINCDYNVNHFFSGDIRMLLFYEVLRRWPC